MTLLEFNQIITKERKKNPEFYKIWMEKEEFDELQAELQELFHSVMKNVKKIGRTYQLMGITIAIYEAELKKTYPAPTRGTVRANSKDLDE